MVENLYNVHYMTFRKFSKGAVVYKLLLNLMLERFFAHFVYVLLL